MERLQRLADALSGAGILLVGLFCFVPWCPLLYRWSSRRKNKKGSGPRLFQMVSGSIEGEERRNAMGRLQDTDFGLFERVYHVYFYAPTSRQRQVGNHYLINWRIHGFEWLRTAGWKRVHLAIHEVAFLVWSAWLIRVEGIGVIDAVEPYVTGLNAYVISRLSGVPYTVEIHHDYNLDYQFLQRPHFAFFPSWQWERRVGHWVLRHAKRVIVDHACYGQYALGNGARPKQVVRVRATSNLGRAGYALATRPRTDVRSRYGMSDRRLLIYVGRLDPDKFVEDLMPCLEHVVARRQDVCLLLAGDGVLRPTILEEADRRGLGAHVRWLGSLPLEEVLDLFASADAVVGTHLGATCFEAALCGAPLVAYEVGRHPEFIIHRSTGLLVPHRNVQQLAQALLEVLEDPVLAEQLKRKARQRVVEQHQPIHFMEDMRRCFQGIMDEQERGKAKTSEPRYAVSDGLSR